MAKLILAFLVFVGAAHAVKGNAEVEKNGVSIAGPAVAESSLKLVELGQYTLEKTSFQKTKIGGLSGLFFRGNQLFVISDDRGKVNEPRFYVMDVAFEKDTVRVEPKKVVFIQSNSGKPTYLDGEGLVSLAEDRILVSCEGNNDKKPRRPPRLFEIGLDGVFKKEWELPADVIPEPLGLQTKGILNNSGGEGLTKSDDGSHVIAAIERPLVQDSNEEELHGRTRFLEYETDTGLFRKSYFYPLYNLKETGYFSTGILSGVSEVLGYKDDQYLVLERGVIMAFTSAPKFISELFVTDLKSAQKVRIKKSDFLFLDKKHVKAWSNDDQNNYEGMAWGPPWKGYNRTLWIVNDNNFSKFEKTQFLVFGIKEEK